MYSEKVLDHFKNPRNQGVIDDASSVGMEGNPVCLLPQEKIFFDNQFETIKKANVGSIVFSHDSSMNKVLYKSITRHNGKIITLKNCLGKISLTPEHLILAIKLPKHYNFLRTKNKQKLMPSWYHAQDLEKHDIILYPLFTKIQDTKFITINTIKKKFDFKSPELSGKVPVNIALLRLFGYFLAEGNIQDKPSKTYISFTLHIKETTIVKDISTIVKKLFGLNVIVKEKPTVNTVIVYLYNAQLARWFKELFGNGATEKKLPEFIMDLPLVKQRSLLKGLWLGDGYINLKRQAPRAGYATISYQLVQQIKNLLLRQGIACSIYTESAKKIGKTQHQQAYRIHIGQRDSLKKISAILSMQYTPNTLYKSISSWFDDNYFYTPITDMQTTNYRGPIHNLEVAKAHSFIAEAFCLHNCGDIMKMYLQIEDDKIKDIKFETLGCAAAIAVSSALTERAMGKTLAEAAAITKDDIVQDLGGLPPIKVHCSMLGVDALHTAVKNYQSKQANNK